MMSLSIADLPQQNLILLDTISGSRAYGLATEQSDTDKRGVFILPPEHYFGLVYQEQVTSERNDECYFEIGKYLKLLGKNNPSAIELLFAPPGTVLYQHSLLQQIQSELVVSKLCRDSFAGYALSQVKRARGLNKKIVQPVPQVLPQPIDCCFMVEAGKSFAAQTWLSQARLDPDKCGLAALPHVKEAYALYYADDDVTGAAHFNGLFRSASQEKFSQDVCLSAIPKGMKPRAWLVFNKDEFARRLRDYHAYRHWENNRNPERYQSTLHHGGGYDAKNMMHTFRLLRMAKEIALTGQPLLQRPDRAELLAIKSGQYSYAELMVKANKELAEVGQLFAESKLPAEPDYQAIESWLIGIRKSCYGI